MQGSKFKSGELVKIKGSNRSFKVHTVYLVFEDPDRIAGFYYSGDMVNDIHESKLELVSGPNGPKSPRINSDSKSKFSENLRKLIKQKDVTFTDLSIGSGVSRSSCYDAAYRGTPTKVNTLVRIAKFFDVSMDELMFGDPVGEEQSAESTRQ